MEKDLVCGMDVDPKTAEYTSIYQGKTYYFCAPGCKRDFDKDPQKYVKAEMPTDGHQHQHGHSA
jgi:YHS domain-containing protein